ncbi:DUF6415 family natural product biosynthesis protein [Streptomyces sp. NPDC087658]|uniref:DUF6415 family natural product biosynthesis protein n=1 Tax=Streptomyces sp. NPDC087658 TaxID=3365800 RepID=UPI0037F6A1DB
MNAPTDTTAAIQAAIDEATTLAGQRPSLAELAEVTDRLRAHIETLLPAAEAAAAGMWQGSREWSALRWHLDGVRERAATDIEPRPFTAHVHVDALRRDCAWLLERYGPGHEREDH